MRAKLLNEKFTEDSDPIKDMGIGLKPHDVLNQFTEDIEKLGFDFRLESVGNNYNTEYDEIDTFIFDEGDKKTALSKLLFDEDYFELIFVYTNRSAEHVIKNSRWGFFFYDRGIVKYLKDAKEIKAIFKQICKIRGVTLLKLNKMIKWQEQQIQTIENIRDMINES